MLRAETATVVSLDTITVRDLPGSGCEVTYDAQLQPRGVLRLADPCSPPCSAGRRPGQGRARGHAGAAGAAMRIAIVGGGVSGLVAARRLHDAGHDTTLFEAGSYPGGHTNTVHVDTGAGAWNVDTGFIVFNDRNYPNFARLLDELGVASRPTT